MATQNWDWIFIAVGWTLAGLGVLIALWALFYDRSRGRKRCPKCWYSMEGAIESEDGAVTCPECGREIGNPRKLHKTRRRWRWLALSMLFIPLGTAGIVGPTLQRDGWDALPSWALIEALAWYDGSSLRDALDARLADPNARRRYMGPPQDMDPRWQESALSERSWRKLSTQLTRLIGDSDRDASRWAANSVAFGLPDPFPALPELKRLLRHEDLLTREFSMRTLFALNLSRFASYSTRGKRMHAESQSCIADLVVTLDLQADDELLIPFPTLDGFPRIGESNVPGQMFYASSPRSVLRASAADTLGKIVVDHVSAIAALERAAKDTDEWVARHAAGALRTIKRRR